MKKLVAIMAVVGWGLYVLSLFLPAVRDPNSSHVHRGIIALLFSWFYLSIAVSHPMLILQRGGLAAALVYVAMPLSNLAMWATPFLLVARHRVASRILPAIVLAFSVMNSLAPLAFPERQTLHLGFYIWSASFWCLAVALYLKRLVSRVPTNDGEERSGAV